MFNALTFVLAGAVLVYAALHIALRATQSAKEPPAIENTIPLISPVVQMIRYRTGFYQRMRNKYGQQMYTIRLPKSRIYVINSTSLIAAAQKQFRALNFTPIMGKAIGKIAGTNETTDSIMTRDLTSEHGFLGGFNKATHATVAPGPALDEMQRQAIEVFKVSLGNLSVSGPRQVSMFAWIRHELLLGTTDAVYGPQNPFRNVEIEEAWYKFEPGVTTLAMRLMPAFLTSKTVQARERLVHAFTDYFSRGGHNEASDLVKARYKYIVDQHGISDVAEVARLEVAGAFAIIANTVPTAFWVLYHIFSNPAILAECRQELSQIVQEQDGIKHVDLNSVQNACPILQSTLHEVLRFHGVQISLRKVMEDHMLDGQFLLKKNSAVMMPATVQHFDTSIWGPDAGHFSHKRFVQSSTGTSAKNINRTAFRGFGGGHHLCPGRHFATMEVLSFAALVILRFDVAPTSGLWTDLRTEKLSARGSAVTLPDDDIEVAVRPRDNEQWNVQFSGRAGLNEIMSEKQGLQS